MVYKTLTHQKSDNADGIRTLGYIASGAATAIAVHKNAHPVVAFGGLAVGAAIGKNHPQAALAIGALALFSALAKR